MCSIRIGSMECRLARSFPHGIGVPVLPINGKYHAYASLLTCTYSDRMQHILVSIFLLHCIFFIISFITILLLCDLKIF